MFLIKNGQTSNILRVFLGNSSVTTGAGLTGLAFNSNGLIISTICNNEASATAYTVAGSTIETVSTLGTYAAPTSTKCRFKEVDPTNHPGVYELHLADARFAVSSARSLKITITGATNLREVDIDVPLTGAGLDPTAAALPANLTKTNGSPLATINVPLGYVPASTPDVLLQWHAITRVSNTQFTTSGSLPAEIDGLVGQIVILQDAAFGYSVRLITAYDENTQQFTIDSAPSTAIADGQYVCIIAVPAQLAYVYARTPASGTLATATQVAACEQAADFAADFATAMGVATEDAQSVEDGLEAQGYTTARAARLDYLDIAVSGATGSTPLSAEDPDRDETWRFDNASQTTAPNQISMTQGEVRTFRMDFTTPLNRASRSTIIHSLGTATISSSAHPPTLGTPAMSLDGKCVDIEFTTVTTPTATTVGNYTVTIPITSTDGQTISRKGTLVVK